MFARMLVALMIAALALTGVAQSEASKKGPNGGPMVTVQGHDIEFVHNGLEIAFYVADHDGVPLATKNLKGRAVVQDGGKTTTVPLSPAAPNRLVGKLQAPLSAKARIVMSTAISAGGHKHTLQARFTAN